jgi:hypothetical protein
VPEDGESLPGTLAGPPAGVVRRSNVAGLVAAALGLALFAWFVKRVGPAEIWEGLRSVRFGLVVIIAITGVRFALRAIAWSICLEPPHRMPFRSAFAAVLAGDAIGNLTPLGLAASEPAKAAFVRPQVPLGPALTALAIENIFYTLSVAAMIAASTIALLSSFDLPDGVREPAWLAVGFIGILFILTALILWRRPSIVRRVLSRVLPATSRLHSRVDTLHDLEGQIYTFAVRRREVLVPVVAAEVGFHALGVVEVYMTWWLIQGTAPSVLLAFILEGANRLITVMFKFVPFQLGVAEWTTGSFTAMLGYGPTIGTTLAIVRKVRVLFWVLIGTLLLVRRGLSRPQRPA